VHLVHLKLLEAEAVVLSRV